MLPARTSLTALVTTAALALGALGLAVAAPGHPEPAGIELRAARGALSISSPQNGQTLFAAGGLRPGQSVSGTLTLANSGEEPALLSLRAHVADTPGPGGGRLSRQLTLTVADVTGGRSPAVLWTGTPAELGEVELGSLGGGHRRDLLVSALLASWTGNAFQGSTLSIGLEWGAVALATPAPTATPTPNVPVVTQGTPATPTGSAANGGVKAGGGAGGGPVVDVSPEALGMPGARTCLSRRKFRITLRAPRGSAIAKAVVRVGRKKVVRVRGNGRRRVRATVNLRGMSGKKVLVRIEVRAGDGRRYRGKRTYTICVAR